MYNNNHAIVRVDNNNVHVPLFLPCFNSLSDF